MSPRELQNDPFGPARWAADVRARLSSLRLSPTREAEIVHELSQHLDDRWQELTSGGATAAEATRLTLAEFRSNEEMAQQLSSLRQARVPPAPAPGAPTGRALHDLWHDLRYAARTAVTHPGFTATAVLTLALGIGATTAIFSVVYGVLLKPLPFSGSDRLVSVMHRAPALTALPVNQGPATYLTYLEQQRTFTDLGIWDTRDVSITGRGNPEQLEALVVSDATLRALQVFPLLGRVFTSEDDAPGRPLRALVTYGYWQRRFAGAANVLGQSLAIDGQAAEIIGILPSSFRFLRTQPSVVIPLQLDRATAPRGVSFGFQALARLRPGVSLDAANVDLARMIALLPADFARLGLQPNVRPLVDDVIGDVKEVLWILMAAVAVVLLIACGNVANLFLTRAEARQPELATRTALGASRFRLARVLLSESVLLALTGGVFGVVCAEATLALLRRIAPTQLPRLDDIGVSPIVVLFAVAVSVASGLFCGLVAVLKFGAPGAQLLTGSGRSVSDAPARHRTRHVLVVTQIALALTLLVVSGLMVRTFLAMRDLNPGFTQPEQVQTFRVMMPAALVPDPQQFARVHENITDQLVRVPGVTSVGLSSSVTMDGEDNANFAYVETALPPEGQLPPTRRFKTVGPGYFETMGNRVVAGRAITWTDIHEGRLVVVVSETFAREYWGPPALAIGRRVRANTPQNPYREIVGVVGEERDDGLNRPATSIVYFPILNESYFRRALVYSVRSSRVGQPAFIQELERAVWSAAPDAPVAVVETLAAIQRRSMAQTTFAMTMLAIAAGVALAIGVVGLYGVISYIAAGRTREIGMRMALGAQAGDVRRLFLAQGMRLMAVGITTGLALALVATRLISAWLFGVAAFDPVTYVVVAAVLAAAALVAIDLPARRATRVDPVVALRANA